MPGEAVRARCPHGLGRLPFFLTVLFLVLALGKVAVGSGESELREHNVWMTCPADPLELEPSNAISCPLDDGTRLF